MKLSQFLEGSERVLPVLPSKPTEKEKGLARRDVGKQAAYKTVTGKDFTSSDIRGELDTQPGLDAQAQAKVLQATKKPGGQPKVLLIMFAGFQGSDEDAERIGDAMTGNLQQRMSQAVNTGDPRALSGDAGKNQVANAEIRSGEGENAIEPFTTPSGTEVTSKSGMRHNLQPVADPGYDAKDNINFPDASDGSWPSSVPYENPEDGRQWYYNAQHDDWNPEMSADDVTNLVGLNMDPLNPDLEVYFDPKTGKPASRVAQASTAGGENPQNPNASSAEIEYFTNNPEGVKMLAALDAGDTDAVQQLAFSQYVGNEGESHEAVDEYLKRTKPPGGMPIGNRGLAGEKLKAVYGGKIDNPFAKEFLIKEKGAPEGIYDTVAIKEAMSDRKRPQEERQELKALYDQIFKNREYEAVRTYLKQNGQDAYVPWEGQRSLQQMNLEHIKALNARGDKGFDHPSNWTWASEPLNKLKNDDALGKGIQKAREGVKAGKKPGVGFKGFAGRAAKSAGQTPQAVQKAISDAVPEVDMEKDEYLQSMSPEKVADARERLQAAMRNIGAKVGQMELQRMIPDVEVKKLGYDDAGFDKFDDERRQKESARIEEDGLLNDLKQKYGLNQFGNWQQWPPQARQEAKDALDKLRKSKDEKGAATVDTGAGLF